MRDIKQGVLKYQDLQLSRQQKYIMITADFSLSTILAQLSLFLTGYIALHIFYNLCLHPLRSYPGPLLARATILTSQNQQYQGTFHTWAQKLHEVYGPVVRVSPWELSVIDPQGWKDAYGHRSAFQKDIQGFYGPDAVSSHSPGLIRADDISHARQRKSVSHAFSDKALKEQEELFKTHVGVLLKKLTEFATSRKKINIVEWYNFTTFDIMADLAFGESLNQLELSSYNPWVKAIFSNAKIIAVSRLARDWGMSRLLNALVPADLKEKRKTHLAFSNQQVAKRMARETDRPDLWSFVTKHNEDMSKVLSTEELYSNGSLFMLAGTETTATLLSGATFLLLKHPEKLARLTQEIREAFISFDDVQINKLIQLPYLQAVLEESLRLYPPVPGGLIRIAPPTGAKMLGQYVPGGTKVSCSSWNISRSALNFKNPTTFAPERFLPEGAEEYASDRKDAINPFSIGPRNCLGKNLAYHEMRLILASTLLNFDIELCEETGDWINDQKAFFIFQKNPLMVRLRAVNSEA